MSDQPKPAQEWTAEKVAWFIQEYGIAWQVKIVEAINAALAAERKKSEDHARGEKEYCEAFDKASKQNQQLRSQLAAERVILNNLRVAAEDAQGQVKQLHDRVDALVDALTNMRFKYPVNTEMAKLIDAALVIK